VRARGPKAFTLVELLIVVGIMGMLLALSLAAVNGARGTARAGACISNLRQLGRALSLYMDSHGECIPRRGQGVQALARIDRQCDWFNCLLVELGGPAYWELAAQGQTPREGDEHVLICPEARDPGARYFLPYAMNMYLSPWIRPEPHRLYELPHPATQVFMADAPGPYSAIYPCDESYSVVARHHGRANVLFLDGHVVAHEGSYLGCGMGDPKRADVRWETDTSGVNWTPGS
jgi:prepilin-type processing-associated H-X9-DG protein/prepilin-type N-terminal cleavage/methylation domain-containing protein